MPFTQMIAGASVAASTGNYVRMLDADGDYTYGFGRNNWWGLQSEGVAQTIQTRLQLNEGDWFLDLQDGTPWSAKVLAKSQAGTRNLVIKARILGTTYLTKLVNYSVALNAARLFQVNAKVVTQFSSDPTSISIPVTLI